MHSCLAWSGNRRMVKERRGGKCLLSIFFILKKKSQTLPPASGGIAREMTYIFNLFDGEIFVLGGFSAEIEVLRKLASPPNPTDDPIICSAKNILPTRFHKLQFCYYDDHNSTADSVNLYVPTWIWFGWYSLRCNLVILLQRPYHQ